MIIKSGDNLDESCCEPNDTISNNAFDAKATLRGRLVDLKVRVAAINHHLKSAAGSDVSKSTLCFIKEEGTGVATACRFFMPIF